MSFVLLVLLVLLLDISFIAFNHKAPSYVYTWKKNIIYIAIQNKEIGGSLNRADKKKATYNTYVDKLQLNFVTVLQYYTYEP